MLQQTRVGAVLPRYREFLRRFPNLRALAAARLDQVLAAWSGLGYYRRARALHQTARLLVGERHGRLPQTSEELHRLPGIGRYTAAAIASIAFGEPCPVLDGNVDRVLRRVLGRPGASAAELLAVAEQLLSRRHPGDFNQAMMELGAMVCLPAEPRCAACPVRNFCATQSAHPRGAPAARQKREVACLLSERGGRVYLLRRQDGESLMPGMWELPCVTASHMGALLAGLGRVDFVLRHAITTTDYRVSVIRMARADLVLSGGRWIPCGVEVPLTGLARKILRRARVI
jgi:A/G-specific adenine glycosylase